VNIYDNIKRLEQRVSELETLIKEKHNASDNSIHNKNLSNRSDAKEGTSGPGGLSSSKLKKQVGRQTVGTGQKGPDQVSGKAVNKTKQV
jgi:cell division septum initiation protein DivIVA